MERRRCREVQQWRVTPKLTPAASMASEAWCHCIFFCTTPFITQTMDSTFLVKYYVKLSSRWHTFNYNTFFLKIHMPLFFLLSGFCLTLRYGRKAYKGSSFCCCCCAGKNLGLCAGDVPHDEETEIFDSVKFYKTRMSRVLPVYYLCFLMALPLIFFGHSYLPPSDVINNFGGCLWAVSLQSSMVIVQGFGPNGPGWTVCTLFFFYWFFPGFIFAFD